jgi:SnoaL-like protein
VDSPIVQVLRLGYETFSKSEGEASQDGLAADFEVIDHILPEGGPEFRGPEALAANFERVKEVFGEARYEPEEFIERDGQVLVRVHATATARHSGLLMDMTIGHLWSFGERGAERLEIFRTWEETIAAVEASA